MKLKELKIITIFDIDSALSSNDISICHSNLEYLLSSYQQLITTIDQIKIYKRIIFLLQKIIQLDDSGTFNRKQIYHNISVVLEHWRFALLMRVPPQQDSQLPLYRYRLLKQEFYFFALRLINKAYEQMLEPNQRFIYASNKLKNKIAQTYLNFLNDSGLKKLLKETMNQQLLSQGLKYISNKASLLPNDNFKKNVEYFYELFFQFCYSCNDHYEQNRIVMINSTINSLSVIIQLQVKSYLSEANLEKCYELIKFFKFLITTFRLKKIPLLISYIKSIQKYICFLKQRIASYNLLMDMVDFTIQKIQKKVYKVPKSQQKENISVQPTYISRKMKQRQNLKTEISKNNIKSKSIYQFIDTVDKNTLDMLRLRSSASIHKNKPQRFEFCSRLRIKSDIEHQAKVSLSINQSQMIRIKTEDMNKKRQQETKVALYEVFLTQYEQRRTSFGIFPRESKLKIFKRSMIHLITQPNKQ